MSVFTISILPLVRHLDFLNRNSIDNKRVRSPNLYEVSLFKTKDSVHSLQFKAIHDGASYFFRAVICSKKKILRDFLLSGVSNFYMFSLVNNVK